MPLTFDDKSAQDKLSRCKQEAAFMEQEVTSDGFIRFAGHAWHLRDWIVNDPNISNSAKDEVRSWNNKAPIPELAVCQDIINSDKHMEITKYTPSTDDASSEQGWGLGRWGKGGYGVGEEQITLMMTDGTEFDALEIVDSVMKFWELFFTRHMLNQDDREELLGKGSRKG
jgi:hypothetical protein